MLLSIIIVSYNEKNYLSEAIESCLVQEGIDDFEIIIGDDGSNDGSIEIINHYVKLFPEKIRSFIMEREEEHNIIASIRASNVIKKGLSLAKGKYISVLSGDDYFCDKYRFKESLSILENDLDKKFISVACNFKRAYSDGNEVTCTYKKNTLKNFNVFWSGEYLHISCFTFRREVFSNGFLLKNFCDDCGLMFSIGSAGEIVYIPDVMFSYRQRTGSIMHKSDLFELHLLELLLFQDILHKELFILPSLVRFRKSIRYLYRNRNLINKEKYVKYVKYDNNSNNIFKKICNINAVEYLMISSICEVLSLYYRIRKRL